MHPASMGKKKDKKIDFRQEPSNGLLLSAKYIYELNSNVNHCVLPALRKFNAFKNKINLLKAQDN